jgi:hypothetical protein
LNDELKAELGMKTKKEHEEDDTFFVPSRFQFTPSTRIPKPTL